MTPEVKRHLFDALLLLVMLGCLAEAAYWTLYDLRPQWWSLCDACDRARLFVRSPNGRWLECPSCAVSRKVRHG